jgi:serine/threonine protein phosphatase PrpC
MEDNDRSTTARVIHPKRVLLPNATVNKEYSAPIPDVFPGVLTLRLELANAKDVGISFDPSTRKIQGVPKQAGDFVLVLCTGQECVEGGSQNTIHLGLTVNPDPRSLWKNLPSDCNAPYCKSDAVSEAIFSGCCTLVAASQRGRSHAHEGKFRDDAFAIKHLPDVDCYVICVADGAGSAKMSRRGSEIACQSMVVALSTKVRVLASGSFVATLQKYKQTSDLQTRNEIVDILYDLLGTSAFAAYKTIQKEAFDASAQVRDFATTLLVAVVKKYDAGFFVCSYAVGDGGICIYHEGKNITVLAEPDGGEYAGETRFLTMSSLWSPDEVRRRLHFQIVNDFTCVTLMTDGVTDAKFETDAGLANLARWDAFWHDITATVPFSPENENVGKQLLNWLAFWSPGNHDDRTIAILFGGLV